jgi:PIN domain
VAKKNMPKLLFVDANIWLDFYRGRSEASLALLRHLESVGDKLIVTYQLEMEYKRNRQVAILEGMKMLSPPTQPAQLGVFSDAKELAATKKGMKAAERRFAKLKKRLARILTQPATHDEVYKTCQRLFHRKSDLVLTRVNPMRRQIRGRATRRFLMGYPPRKPNDTSMGDAINWEWMIDCATQKAAELVIVTRDSDYGCDFDNNTYLNDYLRHEFSDRVSRKRDLVLCRRLSDALKHFAVPVTIEEETEEQNLIEQKPSALADLPGEQLLRLLRHVIDEGRTYAGKLQEDRVASSSAAEKLKGGT